MPKEEEDRSFSALVNLSHDQFLQYISPPQTTGQLSSVSNLMKLSYNQMDKIVKDSQRVIKKTGETKELIDLIQSALQQMLKLEHHIFAIRDELIKRNKGV